MVQNFDDMQKLGKNNLDAMMKSFDAFAKSAQAFAAEMTNYSKKSFEDGTTAIEKMFGAKTPEKVIEIQTDYAKSSYETFIAEATKIGELYSDLAKETYKSFESNLTKAAPVK